MDATEFGELEQLFGAYLHQDFDLEHGSIEDALRDYRDESGAGERAEALREIDRLLERYPDDAALHRALRSLGFAFYPPRWGETSAAWLRRARAILAAPAQPPRRRS